MKRIKDYTDEELKYLANCLSNKVYVREARKMTVIIAEEKAKMYDIVYGALLALRWNNANPEAIQGILDYAEYMFNLTFPKYEGYTNLYAPLMIALQKEKGAILVNEDKLNQWLDY